MKKMFSLTPVIAVALLLISGTIDLNSLFSYVNQTTPVYITKDNTNSNIITDAGATLGRVLFYDKNLSRNNTISCASCHKQEFAFGDTALASIGVNGTTGRHSMRLVNSRYGDEDQFFWDERAATLEIQSTMPIQDHVEMGFSGINGDPDIDSLIQKLSKLDYYKTLFQFVYGDSVITEIRMQNSLAQFVRSIQSFDSKFDAGLAATNDINATFPNYSNAENFGKTLFIEPPQFNANGERIGGGAGCAGCHRPPEFDIDPNSANNGVVGSLAGGIDLTNTRSPSLRDLANPSGGLNGPYMHTGAFNTIPAVINHYNSMPDLPANTNLDQRLRPSGNVQRLNLTNQERGRLTQFLLSLTGSDIYVNEKWSDPFDVNGKIDIIDLTTSVAHHDPIQLKLYPNPVQENLVIEGINEESQLRVISLSGKILKEITLQTDSQILNVNDLKSGTYILQIESTSSKKVLSKRIIKQ